MNTLETVYLGMKLRNPLVASSCGLTASLDKIKRLHEAGVGAVVLKSLFEEQILNETTHLEGYSEYPEAGDYLKTYLTADYLTRYLKLIGDAKRECPVPIIGSISCVGAGDWVGFAGRIEAAGADALELNIFFLPTDKQESSLEIEQRYLKIVASVTAAVRIPVAVKLSPRFTNLLSMIQGIKAAGAAGVVLFNRFYEPDIDVDTLQVIEADVFSSPAELRNSIRWIGMASAQFTKLDLAASTGIHSGDDLVKVLLAGATVGEVCSALYKQGPEVVAEMLRALTLWMQQHDFERIDSFRGKLNYAQVSNPIGYERAQFMKYFGTK